MNKKFCPYGVTIENCCRENDCIDCDKNAEEVKKPPLGLKPRWVHEAQRVNEIFKAMERFSEVEHPIPMDWIYELEELYFREHKGEIQ